MIIYIDTETRSRLDITKVGAGKYTTECSGLIATYAIDKGPVEVWDRYSDPVAHHYGRLQELAERDDTTFVAHNAPFDILALRHGFDLNIPVDKWICTQAWALAHSLPPSLAMVGQALGLPSDMSKIQDGKRLIRKFCIPRRPTKKDDREYNDPREHPEDWAKFIEYAVRDVEAMREIMRRLPRWNYPHMNVEREYWRMDRQIGEFGVPVDTGAAKAIIDSLYGVRRELDAEVVKLTNGKITSATQAKALLEYLREECGVNMPDLTKATVTWALEKMK